MGSSLWLDGGVLRGYYGEGGDVVLPDFIYDVGGYVFRNQTRVRSVTIPDGAIDVGYGAFSGCSGLTRVVLPDSILRIDMYAFSGCESLPVVRLPGKMKILRDSTFIHCSSLRKVEIPDRVEKIEFHAFYGCDALREVRAMGVREVEDPIIDRTARCILPLVPMEQLESKQMQLNGALGYCSFPELYGETAGEYEAYAAEHVSELMEQSIRCRFSEPLRYFAQRGLLTEEGLTDYLEQAQTAKNTEAVAFLLEYKFAQPHAEDDAWNDIDKEFEL